MLVSSGEAEVAGWICAGLSMVILLVRVVAVTIKQGKIDISTIICIAAVLVVGARVGVNQFLLKYGTSNDALRDKSQYFDSHDLETLKTGSILALIARLLDTTFYWLQTCLLLLFYSRIFAVRARWCTVLIRIAWGALPLTYIAVVLATFLDCRPFKRYWQIDPSPGTCVKAYAQLLTQGIANIALDLVLLAISWPIVVARHRSLSEKLRVGALYCLGFFCIIVTCVRIAYIYANGSYQPVRTFWASIQMLVSCFVANAPTIYGSLTLIKRRKSQQSVRRCSRPDDWTQVQSMSTVSSNAPAVGMHLPSSPSNLGKMDGHNEDTDIQVIDAYSMHLDHC